MHRNNNVTVSFTDAWQLSQDDLIKFIHENPKFEDLGGCNIYGIAMAYINNLEIENRGLQLRVKFFESIDKILDHKAF